MKDHPSMCIISSKVAYCPLIAETV